ncbi:MAG: hypothetical protein ACXQTS_07390 [Candidatus Methanospirareceae archaeon]
MHIAEGFLPLEWCLAWFAVTQIPLAIVEGIVVALVLRLLQEHGVEVEMWQPQEVSGSEV